MSQHSAAANRSPQGNPARRGYSLVEALVAMTILALVGSAIMLTLESSLRTTTDAEEQTIADGIARQIIDEAMGGRYKDAGAAPDQYPLAASAWEQAGSGRERYNDTDDFNGFSAQPPQDDKGQALGSENGAGGLRPAAFRVRGGFFQDWREDIEVYYVDESDPSQRLPAGATSNYRAIEVVISREQADGSYKELARARRVHTYLPPSAP